MMQGFALYHLDDYAGRATLPLLDILVCALCAPQQSASQMQLQITAVWRDLYTICGNVV